MAKKSLLEKLGLVESDEVETLSTPVEVGTDFPEQEFLTLQTGLGEHESVQTEIPEGDNFDIEAVYEANDMNPADSVTVYKIQDMLSSLPAEIPTKTKKTTIKSLMATLGYDSVSIQVDAERRMEFLKAVGNEKMNDLFAEMNENEQKIESMKEQIQALTVRNSEAGAAVERISNTVQNEIHLIESVLEFVKDDSAGKESA